MCMVCFCCGVYFRVGGGVKVEGFLSVLALVRIESWVGVVLEIFMVLVLE